MSALRRRPVALAALPIAALVGVLLAGGIRMPDVEGWLTDLSRTLGPWTYVLVAALAFLETGAFVGLVAPGETAVVLGGVVAARGEVDLGVLLALVWLAAALGDLASFLLGRRLGPAFLAAHGPRVGLTAARLERVERFVGRHGPKAVLVGRFIGIVRAVAPFAAGATGLPLRRFVPWSVLGTGAWSALFTLVGYFFWRSFSQATETAAHAALGLALMAAAALAAHAFVRHRRRPVPSAPCG